MRSTTIATGAAVGSSGVKATSTRIGSATYPVTTLRAVPETSEVLPPSGPRDGRLVLRVRPRYLPGLHGLRAGRDPLPRPRGRPGRDAQDVAGARGPPAVRERRRVRHARARDHQRRASSSSTSCEGASLSNNSGSVFIDGALVGRAFDPAAGQLDRCRRGRVVPDGHGDVPARRAPPPRAEHADAVLGRHARRAGRRATCASCSSTSSRGCAARPAALLLTDQNALTVGASGAIFGILGAALVYERQRTFVLGGSAHVDHRDQPDPHASPCRASRSAATSAG